MKLFTVKIPSLSVSAGRIQPPTQFFAVGQGIAVGVLAPGIDLLTP
ncbi:MAG: hypothetical protein R3A10_12995 [Caldilineaceae bacterium]